MNIACQCGEGSQLTLDDVFRDLTLSVPTGFRTFVGNSLVFFHGSKFNLVIGGKGSVVVEAFRPPRPKLSTFPDRCISCVALLACGKRTDAEYAFPMWYVPSHVACVHVLYFCPCITPVLCMLYPMYIHTHVNMLTPHAVRFSKQIACQVSNLGVACRSAAMLREAVASTPRPWHDVSESGMLCGGLRRRFTRGEGMRGHAEVPATSGADGPEPCAGGAWSPATCRQPGGDWQAPLCVESTEKSSLHREIFFRSPLEACAWM